jgi:Protease inhibitor Inh
MTSPTARRRHGARRGARLLAVPAVLAVLAAGCAERLSFGRGESTEPMAAAPTGPAGAPLAAPGGPRTPPPVAMAGRWTLSAGSGGCAMNFGGAPGAAEGTIAPEGGCPGNFFTSRKWAFESNQLIIRDHTGQPLAQLAFGAAGRFDGQAANGQPVALGR